MADSGGIAAIPPRGNERALSGPIQTVTASGPASLSDPGCGETRAFEDCAAVIRLPCAFDSRGLPDFDLVPCFAESSACAIEPACVLKDALAEARDAFLAALERYTLADLIAPRRKLTDLLDPQPRPL